MSCPADDMQRMSDTIDELKRIIELLQKKENWQEPYAFDPRECSLDCWVEQPEARELTRLMEKHCTTQTKGV